MIKKLLVSTLLFIVLFNTVAYALGFSYSAVVESRGSKKYKAIKLTPQIYNNIRGNMADLMLYDKNGEPIPYFINSFAESEIEAKNSYEMKRVNSFVKDEFFYYDYALKHPLNEDIIATSIEVQTDNEGFAKTVEILGSYDNIHWEKVLDDILYNVEGNKKLEIAFDSNKKYTFYRFKISNNLERVSFNSVQLKYNKIMQKKEYFTDTISPNFTVIEKGNKTVIKVKDFKNLKLSSITIKTNSVFKRNVTFNGEESKMLYNLNFKNINYSDLTIPLNQNRIESDTSEIWIDNKDDKPIKIQSIEAKYLVDEMIFDGSKSNEYYLKFGNREAQTPKSYDISNYKEQVLNEGYDVLSIKDIKAETHEVSQEPKKYDYKIIFNIAILIVAVVLGIVIFLKLKK
jgi:hypothetical protein